MLVHNKTEKEKKNEKKDKQGKRNDKRKEDFNQTKRATKEKGVR